MKGVSSSGLWKRCSFFSERDKYLGFNDVTCPKQELPHGIELTLKLLDAGSEVPTNVGSGDIFLVK